MLYGLGPRSRALHRAPRRRRQVRDRSSATASGARARRPAPRTSSPRYRTGIGARRHARRRPPDAAARAPARDRARSTNPLPATGAAEPENRDDGRDERAADRADDGADRLAARLRGLRARASPASARPRRSRSGAATRTHVHVTVAARDRARDHRERRRCFKNLVAAIEAAREPGLDVDDRARSRCATSTSRPRSASIRRTWSRTSSRPSAAPLPRRSRSSAARSASR